MRRKVRQPRLQKGERQAARGKKHSSPSQCLALEGPQFWKQRSAQVAAGPKTPSGLHCHGVWDWPAHGFNYQQQGARNCHHHGACNVRHRQPRAQRPSGLHSHGVWNWRAHSFIRSYSFLQLPEASKRKCGASFLSVHKATLGTGSRGPRAERPRPAFTLMVFRTGEPTVLEACRCIGS